jgi:hypothetical protein
MASNEKTLVQKLSKHAFWPAWKTRIRLPELILLWGGWTSPLMQLEIVKSAPTLLSSLPNKDHDFYRAGCPRNPLTSWPLLEPNPFVPSV